MDLILVRHGEPVRVDGSSGDASRSGPADPGLSEVGVEQARCVGMWLADEEIDHIATSPLRRSRETAAPLAKRIGLTPEVVDGIGEFDARDRDYIPFEEMPRDHEKFTAMVEGRWTDVAGWEDPEVFRRQVVDGIEELIARFPGRRVAVFTHAGVINVYLADLLGISRPLWFYPGYASISRVAASRSGPRSVVSVNETAHLDTERLVAFEGGPA